jgi:hypothetical protein
MSPSVAAALGSLHPVTGGVVQKGLNFRTYTTIFNKFIDMYIDILIYLSTAIGLTPGGSTHLHTNSTQNITINNKTTQITNLEVCWLCPVFANYTLAFAVQLGKKHGKTSVRLAEEIQSIHIIRTPTHYKTHPYTHTHTHTHH